jgi:hypothetical protein
MSSFIVITVTRLVGSGVDVRLGKTVFSSGVSAPVYKESVFGSGQLAFLDSIGESYSVADTDQDGNPTA